MDYFSQIVKIQMSLMPEHRCSEIAGTKYRYFKHTSLNHVYAIRGYWKSQDDFVVDFNTLAKINNYKINFMVKDKVIQVTIKEETQGINDTLQVHYGGNQ